MTAERVGFIVFVFSWIDVEKLLVLHVFIFKILLIYLEIVIPNMLHLNWKAAK